MRRAKIVGITFLSTRPTSQWTRTRRRLRWRRNSRTRCDRAGRAHRIATRPHRNGSDFGSLLSKSEPIAVPGFTRLHSGSRNSMRKPALQARQENEKIPQSITFAGFLLARTTGLEPATTGSTVLLRRVLNPSHTSTLRLPARAGAVPGAVSSKAKGASTMRTWPRSWPRGRRYPSTSGPQFGRWSEPSRPLPSVEVRETRLRTTIRPLTHETIFRLNTF